jgi:hypothetical protein
MIVRMGRRLGVLAALLVGCSTQPVPSELLGTWWQFSWECSCDRSGGPPFYALELRPDRARIAVDGQATPAEVTASGAGDGCVAIGGTEDHLGRRIEPFELCVDHEGRLRGAVERRLDGTSQQWVVALFVGPGLPPPAPDTSAPEVSGPASTPLSSVALRGRAPDASVVLVEREGSVTSGSTLPGGTFCIEAPLPASTRSTFRVYGIDESRTISAPATIEVVQDPDAEPPPDPDCSEDLAACSGEETCGSGIDDDCNGLRDECDPACNGCQEDVFAPNHLPFDAPSIPAGSYSLQLCPCLEDWFSFAVPEGGRVRVTAQFSHTTIDVDLELYRAEDARMNLDPVATSAGTTNTESIDYSASAGGLYLLRVYSFRQDGQGSYTLTVQ